MESSRAFTLIEMMVSLAIIGIMTVAALVSQGAFNKSIILSNTAYDIGLTIRNAAFYGISSRTNTNVPTNSGFGIDFSAGSPTQFILFADTYPAPGVDQSCHPLTPSTQTEVSLSGPDAKAGDCVYENGPNQDFAIQTYKIGGGASIVDFCAISTAGPLYGCASGQGGGVTLNQLDIVFTRPETTANITAISGATKNHSISSACIKLASNSVPPSFRYIYINGLGDVIPNYTSCP